MSKAPPTEATAVIPHRPSACQFMTSITGLVIGILFTLCGVFAFCAIKGGLPPSPPMLHKFSIIGLTNSYFIMVSGGALTLLSAAATIYLFKLAGEQDHAR